MRLGPLTTAGVLVCAVLLTSAQADAKRKGMGKKRRGAFTGHGVDGVELRKEAVPLPSGDVWVYAVNLREDVRVNIYRRDTAGTVVMKDEDGAGPGEATPQFDEQALASLDHIFRCKRTGETRAVDPRLYQTLSTIYDKFGGKRVELVSGFRFQREEGSRHYHASAMDIRVPGVSIRQLRDFADSLDTGGMGVGIYPRAGFVHVDWRAPGEPSFRWTDRSKPHDGGGKRPSRRWKKRPQS
ncbi:MAG TPA: DUF882 domain-containing protein [Kofleriaceae bacterium]|nr:DUF882 domain-containing protein [Kofleriaceae bacterium]